MEVEVVWFHGCDISRVLFQILIVVQCLRYLVVEGMTDLLCADVINELWSRLDAHFNLYLLNESVSVDLALVEALKHIVKLSCGLVSVLHFYNMFLTYP